MRVLLALLVLFFLLPSAVTAQRLSPPPGFESQVLEPTGGDALRPSQWHYRERHGGPQYSWILSRENPDYGPYLVGLRIQVLANVSEHTGKTGPQFVDHFFEQKRRAAVVLASALLRARAFS